MDGPAPGLVGRPSQRGVGTDKYAQPAWAISNSPAPSSSEATLKQKDPGTAIKTRPRPSCVPSYCVTGRPTRRATVCYARSVRCLVPSSVRVARCGARAATPGEPSIHTAAGRCVDVTAARCSGPPASLARPLPFTYTIIHVNCRRLRRRARAPAGRNRTLVRARERGEDNNR